MKEKRKIKVKEESKESKQQKKGQKIFRLWRQGWESQVSKDQEMKLLRTGKRTRTDAD